mmetsp:Transcript_26725/g.50235  ORF Transcript_26725/g.50235 Transcript_26725/m.50235 type:complete len:667 (-) Transcript_26725:177-2177(-)
MTSSVAMSNDLEEGSEQESIQTAGSNFPEREPDLRPPEVESKRYTDLALRGSAYDNALLSLLQPRKGGAIFKPWSLLILNFIAQFAVVILLYQKIGPGAQNQNVAELCHHVGIPSRPVCTPDEVVLFSDFQHLDLDADGFWNFSEAQQLDQTTGGKTNMTTVYQNLLDYIYEGAENLIFPCDINDTVEASADGYWYSGVISWIRSDDKVRVDFVEYPGLELARSQFRKHVNDEIRVCSFPKCVDTDDGALDTEETSCADYNDYHGECDEARLDDDDFKLREMCCVCGGGSKELADAGLSHLPVNVSWKTVVNAEGRECERHGDKAHKRQCREKFSSIPQAVYAQEIAPFVEFCHVPEEDLCVNLQALGILQKAFDPRAPSPHSVPIMYKKAGIARLDDLTEAEMCQKTVSTLCPLLFAPNLALFQDKRTATCGDKTSKIEGDNKIVNFEKSSEYNDTKFGVAHLHFRMFLVLIVFLWAIAAVDEFRQLIVWWNIFWFLPSLRQGEACFVVLKGTDEIEVRGMHKGSRGIGFVFILLPRTVLQFAIFYVGVEYLLSVRSASDLILNSLTLTFLVLVDEMLFEALASEAESSLIRRCKPIEGQPCSCINWILRKTHTTVGIWIFLPILAGILCWIGLDSIKALHMAQSLACLCELHGHEESGSCLSWA